MRKFALFSLCMAAALTACSQDVPYKVIVPVPDKPDGTVVYMYNLDTDEVVDSASVSDQKALFKGDVDEPFIVTVSDGRSKYGTLVLEQGTFTVNQETMMGVGTMLNDQMKAVVDKLNAIAQKAGPDADEEALIAEFNSTARAAVADNSDSPLGYYFFLVYSQMADPDDVLALAEEYPQLADYKKVKAALGDIAAQQATSVGKPFADFEVTYDGVTHRLSDYVGRGDYVLVDFWASWCGPCMREIETIRDIYTKYKDDPKHPLKVLGVAVWDDPEASKATIAKKNIPWECILDARTIPTDIYGIKGIPCIILFGPDGTILSRDLQGESLKAAVADALK